MPEDDSAKSKKGGLRRYFEPWMISHFMVGLVSAAAFLVPLLVQDRGGSPADIGLTLAIMASLILIAPLVGALLDRYHVYRLFHGLGLASIAAGVTVLGFSYGLGGWIAGAFIAGLGLPLVFMTNLALTVGGGFSDDETAKRVAVVTLLFTLGQGIILIVVSFLTAFATPYEVIYAILAAIAAVGLFVTLASNKVAARRATEVSSASRAERAAERAAAKKGGPRPKGLITVAFVAFLASVFLTFAGFSSFDAQYPVFLDDVFGVMVSVSSLTTGIALLVALAVYPVAAIWVARSGARAPFLTNLLVRVVAAGGITALGAAASQGGGVVILLYSLVMVAWPLMDVSSPILASQTNRLGTGVAQGAYTFMIAIGLILGPLISGLIAQALGYPYLSIAFLVANVIALAVAFFFVRVKRPTAATQTAAAPE